MRSTKRTAILLAGWLLLYSRQGNEWSIMGEYPQPQHCAAAMTGAIEQETQGEIGGALAGQPPDNPLRQNAYRKAVQRVQERYRCAEKSA